MAVAARRFFASVSWSPRGLRGASGGRRLDTSSCCLHQTTQAGPQRKPKAKRARFERHETLRANRRDPELERLARTRELVAPLSMVRSEWEAHGGRDQLQTAGLHYAVYRDIFDSVFRPRGFLRAVYEGDRAVERGNIITPSEAASPPVVSLPGEIPETHLCSLILSNPDGHLTRTSRELLHWMVVNIRGGDLSNGETVCPYLPPIPPRGTGLHRIVLTLHTHPSPLPSSGLAGGEGEDWLEQRTFSTPDFVAAHRELVTPHTFCFYQSQWDQSVHSTFMDTLAIPEPLYDLEKPPNRRKQRTAEIREKRSNRYRNL